MVVIEMCKNDKCIKCNDCYRYLGYISEPKKHINNSDIKFYNICGEKNNYKYQWFGGVKELKEQLEKEGKLNKLIDSKNKELKTENEVTENIENIEKIEGDDVNT